MEARAYIKNVRVTPKKLRFLLSEVKKLSPREAVERLMYVEQKPAKILRKAIQSAISNAKTVLKVDEGAFVFKTLTVEEGQKMKRYKAGGRGTVKPFVRKFAHVKVVLVAKKGAQVLEAKALPEPERAKIVEKKEKSQLASKEVTKTIKKS